MFKETGRQSCPAPAKTLPSAGAAVDFSDLSAPLPPKITIRELLETATAQGIALDSVPFRVMVNELSDRTKPSKEERREFLLGVFSEICGEFGLSQFRDKLLPALEKTYGNNPRKVLKKGMELIDEGSRKTEGEIGKFFVSAAEEEARKVLRLTPQIIKDTINKLIKDSHRETDICGVIVFGSWACGEQHPESDLDCLFLTRRGSPQEADSFKSRVANALTRHHLRIEVDDPLNEAVRYDDTEKLRDFLSSPPVNGRFIVICPFDDVRAKIAEAHGRSCAPSELEEPALSPATLPKVTLRDMRNLKRLAQIPNDAMVVLHTGRPVELSAFGMTFKANQNLSRGKIPGTDKEMAPVHLLTEDEFGRLDETARLRGEFNADEPDPDLSPLAWYDPRVNAIEAYIPGTRGNALAEEITVPASAAKRLVVSVIHESRHAAGEGEFRAYRAGWDAALRCGLIDRPVGNLAIMRYIRAAYDTSEINKAEDEFHTLASQDEITQYWSEVEAAQDRSDI